MSSCARANVRITNDKNKRQIPMRASRGLKCENKVYKLKRSIDKSKELLQCQHGKQCTDQSITCKPRCFVKASSSYVICSLRFQIYTKLYKPFARKADLSVSFCCKIHCDWAKSV